MEEEKNIIDGVNITYLLKVLNFVFIYYVFKFYSKIFGKVGSTLEARLGEANLSGKGQMRSSKGDFVRRVD